METIFTYFIQSATATALFYLLYLLLLKNETFYQINRYYLLFGLLLATLLPLFPITYSVVVTPVDNAHFFQMTEATEPFEIDQANLKLTSVHRLFNFSNILLFVYTLGVMFFLIRLSLQMLNMSKIIRDSRSRIIDGVRVNDLKTTMPFSYFNSVFIDIQEYSERELSNIIAHEKVHIRERHWIDLLLTESVTILFWVNPVVWLYERAIKQNHEYLADRGVLLAGYNLGQYRALLINQLTGVKVAGFAHNLNFSLNKKRMEMMKKEKSSRANRLKLLLTLPLITLLIFAFAKKEYVTEVSDTSATSITENAGNFIHAAKSESEKENNGLISEISYGDPVRISGMVQNRNSEPVVGANILVKGTNTGTISDADGHFIVEVPSDGELIFISSGYKKQIYNVSELSLDGTVIILAEGQSISNSADGKVVRNTAVTNNQIRISGFIQDAQSAPLSSVNILINGTTTGTISDGDGQFSIDAPKEAELVFAHIGYEKQVRKVSDLAEKKSLITLIENSSSEGDKMIKLEGTVKGEDGELLTGASVVVKNTSTGTVVDRNGKFELDVPNNSRIVISYIGYQTASRGVTSDFTNDDPFKVTYTLAKGVYNIKLPEVDGEEIIEVLPPSEPLKGTKGEVYTVVEDMPAYKDGGMYGLARDLKIMTDEAIKQTGDRGTAVVGFTVSAEGRVLNPHITESSGSAVLDDVAEKFVQKLDHWKPGSQRGKNVSVDLTVPVRFE